MVPSTEVIPHPLTGEAIELAAETDTLAQWVDQLRELERQAKEARDMIGLELLRRMDAKASWTLRAGDFKITAPSPAPKTEWDVDQLRATLADLRDQGLDEDAIDAALEVVVTYKPRTAGLNALRKLGGEVAERIAACGTEVEPARRVSVKPERSS